MSRRNHCILCPSKPLVKAWTFGHHYRCPKCGLIHNLRSQDSQDEESRYQGVVFDTPQDVAAQQWRWLDQLGVHPKEGERLLDVGCGSGSFLLEAQSHGVNVFGYDISVDAVNRARQRLGERAQIEQSLGPFEGTFSTITLWDVLDHLEAPAQTLADLKERLAPGGTIVVRVRNGPIHLCLRNAELLVRGFIRRPNKGRCLGVVHRYGFSAKNLALLARLNGFREIHWARRVLTDGKVDRTIGQGSWLRLGKKLFSRGADLLSSVTGQNLILSPSLLAALSTGR